MRRPIRVSGSSETKTYGKSAAVRAHEKQQTLPRRSFFGKDTTERLHIFNVLQTRFSPTEALFSGKLSYTDIVRGRCLAGVDSISKGLPEFVSIDEEPNHEIVH